MRLATRTWGVVLILAALGLRPAPARACGGFFCDQPGGFGSLPIAQTAENVLFAVNPNPPAGGSRIEAQIQIFYTGPAAQFSWILPVDAAPTLDTGSDSVFNAIAAATQPSFQVTYSDEGTCRPSVYPPRSATAGGTATGVVVDSAGGAGVQVVFQGAVGPYDAAVIHSPDASALETWLSSNGYFVSDQARGIIETYVSENKYFVALKLMGGEGVNAIRPIVLRFDGESPCIPLRLTAIAAASQLQVNLWVLAAARTVPQNYLELTLNLAKLDWLKGGSNYAALLQQAADEAGGNAFTTEYAGTARIMDGKLWKDGRYDLTSLRAATTPPAFLAALVGQGLPRDAALLAFLEKHIPEPQSLVATGVPETAFYNFISTYYATNAADFAPFDANVVTDALVTEIFAPLTQAQTLFDGFPYVTRLSTFISPAEMTKDPLFLFNSDLGDVSATHQAQAVYECGAMAYDHCSAPVRLTLPDGTLVRLIPDATTAGSCFGQSSAVLTSGAAARMPALAMAWQRRATGTGIVVADNTAVIRNSIAANNAAISGDGCDCAVGPAHGAEGWWVSWSVLLVGGALLLARHRSRRTRALRRMR